MRIQDTEIQQIKSLPIEEVAEHLGMTVVRHKALCPFHDDRHPSLAFSVSRNSYRCFACGAHGGVIDLTMQCLGKNFREACEWLAPTLTPMAREAHRPPLSSPQGGGTGCMTAAPPTFDPTRYARYFEHPWLSNAARHFLFTERRLDPRVVAWCRLTSWRDKQGTNWLQIPYYDPQGRLTGIQSRNLDYPSTPKPPHTGPGSESPGSQGSDGQPPESQSPGSQPPRFHFPPGSQCSLYNLPVLRLLTAGDSLFLTEGPSDCWAMLSSGHKAIAIPSATLLKPRQLTKALAKVPVPIQLHIVPDNDEAGSRLYQQLKEHLPQLVRHQLPRGYKDYAQWYANHL